MSLNGIGYAFHFAREIPAMPWGNRDRERVDQLEAAAHWHLRCFLWRGESPPLAGTFPGRFEARIACQVIREARRLEASRRRRVA